MHCTLCRRLNLLTSKRANLAKVEKRKAAMLLREDKEHNARILVEQIIRDDYTLEAYDLIKQYTEMVRDAAAPLQREVSTSHVGAAVQARDPRVRARICSTQASHASHTTRSHSGDAERLVRRGHSCSLGSTS